MITHHLNTLHYDFMCSTPQVFLYSYFYIGKIHLLWFLLYTWVCLVVSIIIMNDLTMIIFMHIAFSIFWILSTERFPEVKLLSQRAQILLWLLKDIAKMLSKRALPIYNEFKDPFLSNFRSMSTINVILTFFSQCFLYFPWNKGAYDSHIL